MAGQAVWGGHENQGRRELVDGMVCIYSIPRVWQCLVGPPELQPFWSCRIAACVACHSLSGLFLLCNSQTSPLYCMCYSICSNSFALIRFCIEPFPRHCTIVCSTDENDGGFPGAGSLTNGFCRSSLIVMYAILSRCTRSHARGL